MAVNFKYDDLKSQNLSPEDLSKWEAVAESVKARENDIVILDDVTSCNVDRVYAEIHRWKPDIVCVDYITLMNVNRSAGQMWERVTQITQSLKQIARSSKVPIIGVAQTNRASAQDGARLDNIGYSVSVVQDSDIVLGLFSDDEMKKENQMEVRLQKNRDGRTHDAKLKWDMSRMQFGPWSTADLFRAREV